MKVEVEIDVLSEMGSAQAALGVAMMRQSIKHRDSADVRAFLAGIEGEMKRLKEASDALMKNLDEHAP